MVNRLSDYRELLGNGVTERLVGKEVGFRPGGDCLRNPVQRFCNVQEALQVTPHRPAGPRPARPTESAASARA
jgi:hypothetical protein